jgi:cell division protein FtsZ
MVMPGLVNLDFADIRTVMMEMGKAMMGTGEAEGENRAVTAAEAAISNPLLDDVSMKGARGVLINITGSKDMTLFEIDEAANRIREEVDADANIIFGSTFDDNVQGKIRISIVATGIDAAPRPATKPIDHASRPPVSATPAPASVGGYVPSYAPQHSAPHSAAAGGYPVAGQGAGMAALQQSSAPYPHREFAEDVSGVFMTPPAVRADVRAEVVPPRLETVSSPEPIAAAPTVLVNPATRTESPFVSPVSSAQTSSTVRDASSSLPPLPDIMDASSSKPSLFGRLAQTVSGKPGKAEPSVSHRSQPVETVSEATKQDSQKSSPLPAVDEELEIPAFLRRK